MAGQELDELTAMKANETNTINKPEDKIKEQNPFNKPTDKLTEDEKEYIRLLPTLPEGKYVLICKGELKAMGESLDQVMEKLDRSIPVKRVLARRVSKNALQDNIDAITTTKVLAGSSYYFRFDNIRARKDIFSQDIEVGSFKMDTGASISTMREQYINALDLTQIGETEVSGVYGNSRMCNMYFCQLCADRAFAGAEVIANEKQLLGPNFLRYYTIHMNGDEITAIDRE